MSLETWAAEFMPVQANEIKDKSDLECLYHARLKWLGLTKDNLDKHEVRREKRRLMDAEGTPWVLISGYSCSLCLKYSVYEGFMPNCSRCPLKRCAVEYATWLGCGDPQPMIKLLEKAISKLEGEK